MKWIAAMIYDSDGANKEAVCFDVSEGVPWSSWENAPVYPTKLEALNTLLKETEETREDAVRRLVNAAEDYTAVKKAIFEVISWE